MRLLNEQKYPCALAHELCLYIALLYFFFFFIFLGRCFPFFFSFLRDVASSSSSSSFFLGHCLLFFFFFWFIGQASSSVHCSYSFSFCFLLCFFFFCHFLVLIGYHFKQWYINKFIQTHFFYFSTFSLPTKQKWEKLKFFLSSHFSILLPFSILPLFYPSNQMFPKFWLTKCSLIFFFWRKKKTKFMHIFLLDVIEFHN